MFLLYNQDAYQIGCYSLHFTVTGGTIIIIVCYNGFLVIKGFVIERFSIECRKTKTKVIITANQNKGKFQREPMRTQSKYR